jgi:dTDP-4-dehydrorhamnose reductase
MQILRDLHIRPIVSLLHHGSGPRSTSLLDCDFPEKLAAYAQTVAERYPWVEDFTPVNEPNTTARFSALYGVWFPHHTSHRSYMRALINQLKGTALSMERIRGVSPRARLIQTEDMGQITGTEELRSTWELLNKRQWLTYDLLCGKVDRSHAMFLYLQTHGIAEEEIEWFSDHQCNPSVLGLNYYLTSDRYLEHRVGHYPSRISCEGPFADVETVRVSEGSISGFKSLLVRAWEQYGIPVAITEVHLGSSSDEQIRWFAECWDAASSARREGVDCVAITAWALVGSYFWNSLVTDDNGYYEPGLFDVSSGRPVATELAAVVAQVAQGRPLRHASLAKRGWWRHPDRCNIGVDAMFAA